MGRVTHQARQQCRWRGGEGPRYAPNIQRLQRAASLLHPAPLPTPLAPPVRGQLRRTSENLSATSRFRGTCPKGYASPIFHSFFVTALCQTLGSQGVRCQENSAHIRQSLRNHGLGLSYFPVKVMCVVAFSLGSGVQKHRCCE